jgi:hypothetical protein
LALREGKAPILVSDPKEDFVLLIGVNQFARGDFYG